MNDIKRIRDAIGISQKQFGHLMGVSDATVCRWEAGINLSPRTIMAAEHLLFRSQNQDSHDAA